MEDAHPPLHYSTTPSLQPKPVARLDEPGVQQARVPIAELGRAETGGEEGLPLRADRGVPGLRRGRRRPYPPRARSVPAVELHGVGRVGADADLPVPAADDDAVVDVV